MYIKIYVLISIHYLKSSILKVLKKSKKINFKKLKKIKIKRGKNMIVNQKIYENKLNFNCNKIDKESKKQIKASINDIAINILNIYNKNLSSKKLILNSVDKTNLLKNIKYIMQLNDEDMQKITNNFLKECIYSSITFKMVASQERYVKEYGVSISLTNFFITIQAKLAKAVESEKRQAYLEKLASKKASKKPIKTRK